VSDWDFKSRDFKLLDAAKRFADKRAENGCAVEIYNDQSVCIYSGKKRGSQ